LVMQAEIITIPPEDRCRLPLSEILQDLKAKDAPQIWKQRFWASARDRRLVDRLSLYPRLRDYVKRAREKTSSKRWLMAVGIQPVGKNDDPTKAKTITLPSKFFIKATSPKLSLFLLRDDCDKLPAAKFTVRAGSNTSTKVFRAPHVLVAKGFTSTAFADFHVSFQDAVRGITGPKADRDLLLFVAAYLRSPLARYFAFQTSSNWGVSRQEIHVEELLRLPFIRPENTANPRRAGEIVKDVAAIVDDATEAVGELLSNREELILAADLAIEPLLDEYFDILPVEKTLINDTVKVIIPSLRPTLKKKVIPTLRASSPTELSAYTELLCKTLNGWSKSKRYVVRGNAMASEKLGVGVAILQKTLASEAGPQESADSKEILTALAGLRRATSRKLSTFELFRGAKVFDQNRLYLVKPIGRRFWTQTAALNDADEIAGTLLMYVPQEVA
jgi:hypothetical protein